MEDDRTGVFSLGELSMAEIVSLSQCAMGIGPCCLRMSARALKERDHTVRFTKPVSKLAG